MQIDLIQKPTEKKEDLSLKHTKELVVALKKKMKGFNAESEEKVSFSQLKRLFVAGAIKTEGYTLPICGFARVNMFLRLLKTKSFISEFKASGFRDFLPSDEDYIVAKHDIEDLGLNFDFNDINELYFDDVNEISFLQVYL
jgi:hypothetical protein